MAVLFEGKAIVGPRAVAVAVGNDCTATAVRKYVRVNAKALTGEEWPDTRTEHEYTPALARDIVSGMRSGSAGTAKVLRSKAERAADRAESVAVVTAAAVMPPTSTKA
jgi:hypothetical protein